MAEPKHDPDVIPPTPFGPGEDWPATYELMIGVGELRDVTPTTDDIFDEYEEARHLHVGPLGFVAVDTRTREERKR